MDSTHRSEHEMAIENMRPSANISMPTNGYIASREVHFSPMPTLQPRAQSIATTTVPLLKPVSSASTLPTQQSSFAKNATPQIDINAYIEQSRALLETQRTNFEHERKTFEAERKLWDAERKMMLSRIADLELKNNRKSGGRRRYSNEQPSGSLQSFRSDFRLSSNYSNGSSEMETAVTSSDPPVWAGPEKRPSVTRVFSHESSNPRRMDLHLPRISETRVLSPPRAGSLSPNARVHDFPPPTSVSIPIEKLDSRLDGITLKSTGLPPAIVAKVISPNESSPSNASPSSKTPLNASKEIPVQALMIPSPPNLKTNAGHTPLAFEGPIDDSRGASYIPTPTKDETKSPPVVLAERPVRPPHERSDSYFPDPTPGKDEEAELAGAAEPPVTTVLSEDPELKGPLALESNHQEGQSNAFLNELDARLIAEAKKILGPSPDSTREEGVKREKSEEEDIPKLRLKASKNFGTAFGASDCGVMR